ncbi:MAG: hypothetical protein IT375_01760 [Polyangiaceae bacterium]|nr:hypothetical protein [Polyangiaceae bacterium]
MKRGLPLALLAACSSSPTEPSVHVVVRAEVGSQLSLAQSQIEPTSALVGMRSAADQIDLQIRAGTPTVSVKTPGACPLEIAVADAPAKATVKPWLSVAGGDLAQIGFDTPFSVTLTPGCREALTAKVEWKQTGGEPIELITENNGFVVRGRTRPLDAAVPWGIVPLSPRTRGEVELTATSAGHTLKVRVSAAARASGLPSLALSQRVLLGGTGWRVKDHAKGGKAEITQHGALGAFQPDARGRWVLADGDGRELSLVVGTHADTLLDCGRSDCHAGAAGAAQGTRMTQVFERGLRGQIPRYDVACALPCHTAGEPGLPDGGFTQVARELGLSGHFATGPEAWNELPRPLRRLGGVTCTACHGPGAIPEPAARWAVLRSDVCATCHDAPPRYGHVQAWSATRMAKADRDERARKTEGCRGCHTTAGFLAKIGVRKDAGPPTPDLQLGIGCAACHAPHGEHLDRALLRARPAGKLPDSASVSRVCIECHAATTTLLFEHDAPGAHAAVPKGCVGCHAGEAGRGKNHGFQIDRARCGRGCHAEGVPKADASIPQRIEAALSKLGLKHDAAQPLHARELGKVADPKRRRALELLQLLAGDPAAASHHAKRARALLGEAEGLLGIE